MFKCKLLPPSTVHQNTEEAFKPELSYVVVSCLPVGGADDTHVVAGMEVAQLQQHHGQVVHKELGVHKGRRELDDAVVVFILLRTHRALMSAAAAGMSKAFIGLMLHGSAT